MRVLKYLLPVVVATFGVGSVFGEDRGGGGFSTTKEAQQRDSEALREYIKSKRAINVKEKGGYLTLSGDVRAEYYFMKAKTRGVSQRGIGTRNLYPNSYYNSVYEKWSKSEWKHKSRLERVKHRDDRDKIYAPISTVEPDAEANIILDYAADRGWSTLHLKFQNPYGFKQIDRKKGVYIADSKKILYGSGTVDNIELRKAYLGYNVWEQGTSRFDVEMGRRRLYEVFDSRVQFGSNFDGILLRSSRSFEGITDFSLKLGFFVIDSSVYHWGQVGELGCLNIADSGVDFKYSLINWERRGLNRYGKHHVLGCRFLNSQVTLAYNLSPDITSVKTQIFAAGLVNHAAPQKKQTYHKLQNKAYYFGVKAGEVVRRGDIAGDICYQYVQAQAVPERDIAGLSRDNPRGVSFYARRSGGFGNYKGYRIQGLYGLTDNITIDSHFDRVHQACRAIGGKHRAFEFYIAAIFAF